MIELYLFIIIIALLVGFGAYIKETNKQIIALTKAVKATSFNDMLLIDKKQDEETQEEERPDIVPITSLTDEDYMKAIKENIANNEE